MPKVPRIYTRAGDDGTTGLVGGARVRKDDLRIQTFGTLDELSSVIGIARSAIAQLPHADDALHRVGQWLAWTQDALFNLGSQLATPTEKARADMPAVTAADVKALERAIDRTQEELPPLTNFIHPGGALAGAYLHFARTICRRAERLLVALRSVQQGIPQECERYVNRLSDALFVWARYVNHRLNVPEHRWDPHANAPTVS